MGKSRRTAGRAPKKGKGTLKPTPNTRLTAQNRKLLGKHYAGKYRTGKG